MYSLARAAVFCLAVGVTLSGCDLSHLFSDNPDVQFHEQYNVLQQRLYDMRLDMEHLPARDSSDLQDLATNAGQVTMAINDMLRHPDPLRKAPLEKLLAQWQSIERHLQELQLHEQNYQAFMQQRAAVNTQLAVLTDSIDRLAAAVVQARLSAEIVYRTTGLLYINERMQHSLVLLMDDSDNGMVIMDRFGRDTMVFKQTLAGIYAEVAKLRPQRRYKTLLDQIENLQREFTRQGPLLEQVTDGITDYLDFLDRHDKVQEQLEQAAQLLEQLRNPAAQSTT